MSFCPQCGAPTSPGLSFCTACGRTLAAGAVAAPAAAPFAPAPPAASGRPVGKRVEPWIVVLLALVTFGVYPLVLWWRTSKEVDAYAGSSTHPRVRIGVFIVIASFVIAVVLVVSMIGSMMSAILSDPEGYDPTLATTAMATNPLYLVLAGAQVAGALVLYPALGKMWSVLQAEEARLGRHDHLNPTTAMGIGIGATIVGALSSASTFFLASADPAMNATLSFVFGAVGLALSVALFWVMYVTQKRLNELWQAVFPAGWS